MLTFTHISDTHEHHTLDLVNILPAADVLVHSGDFSWRAKLDDVKRFNDWLGLLAEKYEHIIFVPGNHDIILQDAPEDCKKILTNCTTLIDEEVTIEGVRIHGTPWSPTFGHNWAFMGNEYRLSHYYQKIAPGVDILVSHGPAYGILDGVPTWSGAKCDWDLRHTGSHALAKAIRDVKPKYVLLGHIHEGHGYVEVDGVKYINSSIMDANYRPVNKAHCFGFDNSKKPPEAEAPEGQQDGDHNKGSE